MARNTIVTETIAIAQLAALKTALESGSANPQPRLQFFEGGQPASPDVSPGQTPVFEYLLDFPNTVSSPTGTSPGATMAVAGLPKNALALKNTSTGLSWHRFIDRDGVGVLDGSSGTNPAAFNIYTNQIIFTTGSQMELQNPLNMTQRQGPSG